ncbi:SDR family oxidoreductase [Rothia sp. ZJ1223]|uniref:SDR family oxidoreductase n=1 Tax=Rothia sp. ZJ1223 TaxID=2811098 RepID=UPI00195C4F01|nr:SDR family oxidoreductase [Rothia sp. ZJ1223]MBM7050866.1 SDR family oxidoreductase [Rothia sp. ZJ1223]
MIPENPFTPENSRGKIAVVTGASSGIGRATVEQMRATGWTVYAAARRADRLETLAQETGAIALTLDTTDTDAVRETAQRVLQETGGRLDALVNIAGGARGADTVATGSAEDWQKMYEVNVLGTLNMVQAFLPALRDNSEGTVLNLTSTAAEAGYEGGGGYNASKFGERALTEALRLEEAENNVRVIEIRPGMVHTPEFSKLRLGSDEAAAKVYAGVEKPLFAEDVAQTVVFALNVPHHINLDHITMRPVAQAAQYKVIRKGI